MENFKIDTEDMCFEETRYINRGRDREVWNHSYITGEQAAHEGGIQDFSRQTLEDRIEYIIRYGGHSRNRDTEYKLCPLEIAAPQKDFDMTNFKTENFKVVPVVREIPDPVVLQPVIYRGEKYYLIQTAWGEEASDNLVRNEIFN